MIKITRHDLLESKTALEALGKVYTPVGKENYWFVKLLDIIKRKLKQVTKEYNAASNQLVKEYGTVQAEGSMKGKLGIAQSDLETMEKYNQAMEKFMDEEITLEHIKKITLTQLENAHVALQLNDQVQLMWLFVEEEECDI